MHLCLCSEGYSIFLGRNVVGLWSAINIGWVGPVVDLIYRQAFLVKLLLQIGRP